MPLTAGGRRRRTLQDSCILESKGLTFKNCVLYFHASQDGFLCLVSFHLQDYSLLLEESELSLLWLRVTRWTGGQMDLYKKISFLVGRMERWMNGQMDGWLVAGWRKRQRMYKMQTFSYFFTLQFNYHFTMLSPLFLLGTQLWLISPYCCLHLNSLDYWRFAFMKGHDKNVTWLVKDKYRKDDGSDYDFEFFFKELNAFLQTPYY